MKNIWLDGIMGVVLGDALGNPVQFMSREDVRKAPVTGMRGGGAYKTPVGTWTDDTSMTLAALSSINRLGMIDPKDIMEQFCKWLKEGKYTPFGEAFDIGRGTWDAIMRYLREGDIKTCGGIFERENGNGSLMRIMPACLYCAELQIKGLLTDEEAAGLIHTVSGLTHNHLRSKIACGLYYFMVRALLDPAPDMETDLIHRLSEGLDDGFAFYGSRLQCVTELSHYARLRNLFSFKDLPAQEIRSSGYVVDTLEAAVWSLITTESFETALLKAVNLGEDADSVGAVCGGLAGLYYGYEDMPADWLNVLQRREWIETLCTQDGAGDAE